MGNVYVLFWASTIFNKVYIYSFHNHKKKAIKGKKEIKTSVRLLSLVSSNARPTMKQGWLRGHAGPEKAPSPAGLSQTPPSPPSARVKCA